MNKCCEETRENLEAILAILDEDGDLLASNRYKKDILINQIKNNLQALEWYLAFTDEDPQGDTNLFSNVRDMRTYDLYKKYGIVPVGFTRDDVTQQQWDYLNNIGMTTDTYCAECTQLSNDGNQDTLCESCSLDVRFDNNRGISEHDMTHDHKFEPMAIRIWQDDKNSWFVTANGVDEPIELYCPGCGVRVDTQSACPKCISEYSDGFMIRRLKNKPVEEKKIVICGLTQRVAGQTSGDDILPPTVPRVDIWWCDESKKWFTNAFGGEEQVELYCPGCDIHVDTPSACPECVPKFKSAGVAVMRIKQEK